jgi:hypothetical protein
MAECFFCWSKGASYRREGDATNVDCPVCGKYRISGTAISMWPGMLEKSRREKRIRANASGWLRRHQRISIDSDDLKRIRDLLTPSFHERADKLLLEMEKRTEWAGQMIAITIPEWSSICWCMWEEFDEILNYLYLEKWIEISKGPHLGGGHKAKITPKGWAHLEELKSRNPESQQGYVAMRFDKDMDYALIEGIEPAVLAAGYKPLRVDQQEHIGKIDDFIMAQIRQSKFMVADFTRQRQSVYFEAGFALGLNIPVFWTCREDDLGNLHFDIRQFNCIDWEDAPELKKRLMNRIMAVLGKGRLDTDLMPT